MRKLATLSIAALTVLTLTSCGTTDSGTNTSKKASNPKTAQTKGEITKAKFDAITLGETDGTSLETVKQSFGKAPDQTTSATVQNIKTDLNTWRGVAGGGVTSTVGIGFSNNHAVSKAITGLKVNRPQKITLAQFNAINTGASQADVRKQLGDPNGYDDTKVAGYSADIWQYTSGVQGSLGANCHITFTNGLVSGKIQTSMQ